MDSSFVHHGHHELCLTVRYRTNDESIVNDDHHHHHQDDESSFHNLFARLPTSVVEELYQMALQQQTLEMTMTTTSSQITNSSTAAAATASAVNPVDKEAKEDWNQFQRWNISSSVTTAIDFLPLAITIVQQNDDDDDDDNSEEASTSTTSNTTTTAIGVTEKRTTLYGSYNGGEATNSPPGRTLSQNLSSIQLRGRNDMSDTENCETNIIDLPRQFFLPRTNVTKVLVRALPQIVDADEIVVEPVSVEDWVLLQSAATWLEHGGLLRQVSVVYPNQMVSLYLRGWGAARVRVCSDTFHRGVSRNGDSRRDPAQALPCMRLVANTQIIIKPKESIKSKRMMSSSPLRLHPGFYDFDCIMQELATRLNVELVRVAQGCALVHPVTAANMYCIEAGCLLSLQRANRKNALSAVLRVSTSDNVPEDCLVVHPITRVDMQLHLYDDMVVLQQLSLDQELELRNGSIVKLAQTGGVRVSVEKVDIAHYRTGYPWRTPDIGSDDLVFPADASEGTGDVEEIESSALLPPSGFLDSPLRVGGLFQIPWADTPGNKRPSQCFRLLVQPIQDGMGKPQVEGASILAQDLRHLLPLGVTTIPGESIVTEEPMFLSDSLISLPCQSSIMESVTSARCAVFVCGGYGSGKTHMCLTIGAASLLSEGRRTVYVDCRRLKDSKGMQLSSILEELCDCFDAAVRFSGVIVLDDLDELTPNLATLNSDSGSTHVQQINPILAEQCHSIESVLCHLVDSIHPTSKVLVVVSCKDEERLSSSVRSVLSLTNPILLPNLSGEGRCDLFRSLVKSSLQRLHGIADNLPALDFVHSVRKQTHGFRPRDMEQLAARTVRLLSEQPLRSMQDAFEEAIDGYVPISKLSASAEQPSESMGLVDVGGLFEVKRELNATVVHPSLYKRIYSNAKIRLPTGILLFSEPGTGKSFIVPALAKECGLPLIVCRGPEMLDKYIGASEMKVRELFTRAASVAPSIIWIDELDSLAPRRGSDSSGVTDRIVNQLLTFLDGVEGSSSNGPIYVIATSSRPDKIDPALLRPGRLERHIYVGLPEDKDEWTDLLLKTAGRYDVSKDLLDFIASGDLFLELEQDDLLRWLSAADLNSVFNSAQLMVAHEVLASNTGPLDTDHRSFRSIIQLDHLREAFRSTRPSLASADRKYLHNIYLPFRRQVGGPKERTNTTREQQGLRVALK